MQVTDEWVSENVEGQGSVANFRNNLLQVWCLRPCTPITCIHMSLATCHHIHVTVLPSSCTVTASLQKQGGLGI